MHKPTVAKIDHEIASRDAPRGTYTGVRRGALGRENCAGEVRDVRETPENARRAAIALGAHRVRWTSSEPTSMGDRGDAIYVEVQRYANGRLVA